MFKNSLNSQSKQLDWGYLASLAHAFWDRIRCTDFRFLMFPPRCFTSPSRGFFSTHDPWFSHGGASKQLQQLHPCCRGRYIWFCLILPRFRSSWKSPWGDKGDIPYDIPFIVIRVSNHPERKKTVSGKCGLLTSYIFFNHNMRIIKTSKHPWNGGINPSCCTCRFLLCTMTRVIWSLCWWNISIGLLTLSQ